MDADASSDAVGVFDGGNAVTVINVTLVAHADSTVANDVATTIAIIIDTAVVANVASIDNVAASVANTIFSRGYH